MRILRSTCSTPISASISCSTFSSRSAVFSVSSSAWRSEIFTDRCEATVSASFAGSSICATDASVSAGTFLLSLMYCSKLVLTVRSSASVSLRSPARLPESSRSSPGRNRVRRRSR